jgi:hypothetical protein
MRFVKQPLKNYPSAPPLVVFDAQGTDRLSERDVVGARFHVIGEPCSAMYDMEMRNYIGTTEASCQPYIIKLEPPVPGESSVLKP